MSSVTDKKVPSRSFVLPPRHRLFAIFDDPAEGLKVIDELRHGGFAGTEDIWCYCGEDGLERLGLGTTARSVRMRAVRLAQRTFSSDVEYLEVLGEALREGALVVAVWVSDDAADGLAAQMREGHAHSFAYCAHWDFVPVAA